jgi:hypothetical protein
MNLPDYNFLSAPLWIVSLLHWVTLTVHFVAMNFVFGGTMVLLLSRLDNKWQQAAVKRYIKLLPTVMAATITFGVAPLLFLQLTFSRLVYSAAIISGWLWLLIVVAAIVAYYFFYGAAFSVDKAGGRLARHLTAAIIGLFYISFVYSSIFSLAERPELMGVMYMHTQSGWSLNPDVGVYLFRWLHMILGALTLGGYFVGMIGRDEPAVFEAGRRAYLVGMVTTMVAGLVYLFTLGDYLLPFMRSLGIWTMTVGFFLSLGSLHFFFKKKFLPAGLMLFSSMFLMVITRHELRLLRLEGIYDPSTIPVQPQWSVFCVFLVSFLLAVGLVTYLLRLCFTSDRKIV